MRALWIMLLIGASHGDPGGPRIIPPTSVKLDPLVAGDKRPCRSASLRERCSQVTTAAGAIAFTTAPQTLSGNSCSAAVTLTAQDGSGHTAVAPSNVTVALSSSSGTLVFYSDACTTPVISVAIGVGTATVSFYFKDSTSGTPTLVASASGGISGAVSQGETIRSQTQLVFTSTAYNGPGNICIGPLTVQSQDVSSAPALPAGTSTVSLTSTSGTTVFYSNAGCTAVVTTVTLAPSSASFYAKEPIYTSPTVTATNGSYSATQVITQTSGAPTQVVFTTAAQTLSSGVCSAAVTLAAKDSGAHVVNVGSTETVALTSTSGTTVFYSDACSTPTTTANIASGTSGSTFYFKDTASGSPTLTATSSGGFSSSASQAQTIRSQTQLVFTSTAYSGPGNVCQLAGIQSRDAVGAGAPPITTAVGLTSSSTTTKFYSDASCTAPITSVTISGSTAGFYWQEPYNVSPTLTATNGSFTGTQAQTQTSGVIFQYVGTNSSLNSVKGDVGTFTRASVATCGNGATYTRLASGAPCYDSALGVRLENGTTNLLLYSEQLDNAAAWSATASGAVAPTVTANGAAGPDGTTTAEQIDLPATAAAQYSIVSQSISMVAGTYVASLWLRAVSGTGTVYVTVLTGGAYQASTACPVTTTWKRCFTPSFGNGGATATYVVELGFDGRDSGQPATESALSIYASSGQVEKHYIATAYATTAGTSVTRPDESLYITTSGVPGTSFSWAFDYTPNMFRPPIGFQSNTIDMDPFLFDSWNGNGVKFFMNVNGALGSISCTTNLSSAALTWVAGTTYHIQVDSNGSTGTIKRAGTTVATGALVCTASNNTKNWVGSYGSQNNPAFGYMKNVCIGSASGVCP